MGGVLGQVLHRSRASACPELHRQTRQPHTPRDNHDHLGPVHLAAVQICAVVSGDHAGSRTRVAAVLQRRSACERGEIGSRLGPTVTGDHTDGTRGADSERQ